VFYQIQYFSFLEKSNATVVYINIIFEQSNTAHGWGIKTAIAVVVLNKTNWIPCSWRKSVWHVEV